MKKLSVYKISVSFAGAFLGAGYISGQELWQFFGFFGAKGLLGICIAMSLIAVFGMALSYIVDHTKVAEVDKIFVPWDRLHWGRRFAILLQFLLLFGVAAIMVAGAGVLFFRLFSLPTALGSALIAALASYIAMRGVQGVVKVFSLLVPIMVGITVALSAAAIMQYGMALPETASANSQNPLIHSAAVGMILYVFYNFFGTVGILAPLAKTAGSHKSYRRGVLIGTCILALIALSIVMVEISLGGIASAELPMLELAFAMNRPLGYVYGILLILSMFGSAVSMIVSLMTCLAAKSQCAAKHPKSTCVAIGFSAFVGSLVGFNDLIGTIYPILGYGGSVFIVCMMINAVQLLMKNHSKSEQLQC